MSTSTVSSWEVWSKSQGKVVSVDESFTDNIWHIVSTDIKKERSYDRALWDAIDEGTTS